MGRGKTPIKRIENKTNRQVTFSKRRSGLFKKAKELSVLCDVQISLIICNSTSKFYDFVNSTTTQKEVFDAYQKAKGIDLWHTHYEKMREELRKLRDTNQKLQRAIRQRMGKDLEDMKLGELLQLEITMASALDCVTKEKMNVIRRKRDTMSKKSREREKMVSPGEELYQSQILMDGWGQIYSYPVHHVHMVDPVPVPIPMHIP